MDIPAFNIPFFSGNIDSLGLPPHVIDIDQEPSTHNGVEASISGWMANQGDKCKTREIGYLKEACSTQVVKEKELITNSGEEGGQDTGSESPSHQWPRDEKRDGLGFDGGRWKEQDPWTANYGVQESFPSPAAIESQSHTLQDFSSFLGSSSPQRVDFSSLQLYQSQAESEDLAFWEVKVLKHRKPLYIKIVKSILP
ncbi:hypothetical protein Ddye_013799 [Dipteronia dyeriana]|uniref:Uncharacterized protein n=1 Tax=Dipteronia dyeriana TaxID=168575 RepID=A0AAD9X727_9ROSI|nr:hypothetical protein Ddye_013799 [Dipteronia dyeriana]